MAWTPKHRVYRVFAPKEGDFASFILPRSAIVASADQSDRAEFCVFYEGNKFASEALNRFVDRVHTAAGRADQNYPTIARSFAQAADLIEIARYDLYLGVLEITNSEAFADWLDGEPIDLHQDPDVVPTAKALQTWDAHKRALALQQLDELRRARIVAAMDSLSPKQEIDR